MAAGRRYRNDQVFLKPDFIFTQQERYDVTQSENIIGTADEMHIFPIRVLQC